MLSVQIHALLFKWQHDGVQIKPIANNLHKKVTSIGSEWPPEANGHQEVFCRLGVLLTD